MTSIWSDPHDQQGHIPSRSDNNGPVGQGQTAAQPDFDNVIQGCTCSWCSRNRYNPQSVGDTIEYQNPSGNQILGSDDPISVATTTGGQTEVWSDVPQAPQDQENVGCALLPEAVDPLQVQAVQTSATLDQAQVLDTSVSERLRRLAGRYVDNPESHVSGVYLESGPSGRFRVVITVEIGDILGDTID